MITMLVGDVGGTHTRLGICGLPEEDCRDVSINRNGQLQGAGLQVNCVEIFTNSDFTSLRQIMAAYLRAYPRLHPARVCVGIAAPINGLDVQMTNLNWEIHSADLAQLLPVTNSANTENVLLINDFESLAYALPHLQREDLQPLNAHPVDRAGVRVVMGPGTGLGVAALVPVSEGGYVAVRGLGGHVEVPVRTAFELQLLDEVCRDCGYDMVSAEQVVSGPGLKELYRAHAHLAGHEAQPLDASQITTAALNGENPDAVATLRQFCVWLMRIASDLALIFQSTGGLYFAGGVAVHLAPQLASAEMLAAFHDKGRMSEFVRGIPLRVITAATPALLGVAAAGRQHFITRTGS